MPAPLSDEYWALWCYEYVDLSKTTFHANDAMAKARGIGRKSVGSNVMRMRERGFLEPSEGKTKPAKLGPKAEAILHRMGVVQRSRVAIDLQIIGATKAEALAELWDVVAQLEAWDGRAGQPFPYEPNRRGK